MVPGMAASMATRVVIGAEAEASKRTERAPTTAALGIAIVLGAGCLIAALASGVVFAASSDGDRAAARLAGIEWLLAAIAIFLLGWLLQMLIGPRGE